MITLDFETRSEADLIKIGAWAYAEHQSTEVLCAVFKKGTETLLLKKQQCLTPHPTITQWIKDGEVFEAHNAFFEEAIWFNIMHKRNGWLNIPIKQWRCSAAKASAHSLPRALGKAAAVMRLPAQKDMTGRNIMLKMCKPRKPTKYDKSKWHESTRDFELLEQYCVQDVETEEALSQALRPLHPHEQKVWFLDQLINRRGIMVDEEAVDAAIEIAEKRTKELNAEVRVVTKGVLTNLTQVARAQMWIENQGYEMGGFTKEDVKELLDTPDLPSYIRRVLEIRQEVSKTSVKKFDAFKRALCADGRVRDAFMYHGASTGRWAGKLVQFHNLPRGSIKHIDSAVEVLKRKDLKEIEFYYGSPFDFLSSLIRSVIVSSAGHDLMVADFASIEARVLAWLARDDQGMEEYRKGIDRYVNMAATIYNIRPDKVTRDQRQLGKQAILGAGYQMGPRRFRETCASYGMDISESLSERAIEAYRERNNKVKSYWYGVEDAAVSAIQSRRVVPFGRVRFGVHKGFLYCILPSERALAYFDPKLEEVETPWGAKKLQMTYLGINSQTKQWERMKTYGGMLTENITQAVARDLLASAMLRCEQKDYKVIMHVHDEIVCEIPEGFGDVKEFEELICQLPPWAAGIPIEAEGWRGKRYRK